MQKGSVNRAFKALGTVNTIFVYDAFNRKAVDEAVRRVLEIDDRMSVFKPGSDVSRINANAGKDFVKIGPDTLHLLKRAARISEASEGVFDITIAPLVALWGIGKKQRFIPNATELEETKRLVGYRDLILDEVNLCAMLANFGQRIDLGGIAKGYAANEVRRILGKYDIRNAIVNLGGNIWAMGMKHGVLPWRIGVQHPLRPAGVYMGELEIRDETVVTSGSYEQFFIKDGTRYHHILDPRTGYPAETGLFGVTVIGNSSMDMDALATAAFVLGPGKGAGLVRQMNAKAVFISTDGKVFTTAELHDRFRLIPEVETQK